jgi:hypothetical protein
MKTTNYNKSEIMKRAWSIYRGTSIYSVSFSIALSRAWEIEKENKAYEAKQAEIANTTWGTAKRGSIMFDMNSLANDITNFYRNNTYNGD